MNDDIVKLKGTTAGLQLVISPGASMDDIIGSLTEKLESESALHFFPRGTWVYILPGLISAEAAAKIKRLFNRHGVFFRIEENPPEKKLPPVAPAMAATSILAAAKDNFPKNDPIAPPLFNTAPEAMPANDGKSGSQPPTTGDATSPMRVINRTIRSGESITSQGGIIIIGNVNPGAEIIAGGSIDIRGTCRGLVHAGAYGDTDAVVIADRLRPVQIRIADCIAQPPDGLENPTSPERAQIKENAIVIEKIER